MVLTIKSSIYVMQYIPQLNIHKSHANTFSLIHFFIIGLYLDVLHSWAAIGYMCNPKGIIT